MSNKTVNNKIIHRNNCKFQKHYLFYLMIYAHLRNCIFGLFIPDVLSGTHFTTDNITELLLWYKHIGLSRKHTNHIFFRMLRRKNKT